MSSQGSAPVQDSEIDAVLDIYREYGRPLGSSGVLLATGVVTVENDARVRAVIDEMERRGLLYVKHPADKHLAENIYELADTRDSSQSDERASSAASCVPGEPE